MKNHSTNNVRSSLLLLRGIVNQNMHDGQFADIEAHNLNHNLLAVRYGEGAYNLPPTH